MNPDDTDAQQRGDAPKAPPVDPAGMKGAHGRTGRLLKHAGLPFEADEFDESDADAAGDPPAASSGPDSP